MPDKKELDRLFNLKAAFPNDEEKKAFFKAAQENNIAQLGAIVDKWPDAPKTWKASLGDTVIKECYHQMTQQTIEFLVNRGADINAFDKDGFWNPLALAAFSGRLDDVEKLLRCGAEVDAISRYDKTALYWATKQGQAACADVLVLCGANPAKGYEGAADNAEMRAVIDAALQRREQFLASAQAQATDATSEAPQAEAETASPIHVMKRLQLKKAGIMLEPEAEAPAAPPTETKAQEPSRKSWLKRFLRK